MPSLASMFLLESLKCKRVQSLIPRARTSTFALKVDLADWPELGALADVFQRPLLVDCFSNSGAAVVNGHGQEPNSCLKPPSKC